MIAFLLLLVASVFLGSEFLAIPFPAFQLTIYRICALVVWPVIIFLLCRRHPALDYNKEKYSHWIVRVYVFWWLWGLVSVLWALDTLAWIRGFFLLTIGIASIIALSLGVRNSHDWYLLLKAIWMMMTILFLLGFFEIISNHYFFADVNQLDKYGTFVSQPLTRIPVTIFRNQNDYATMLLAYVTVNIISFFKTTHGLKKLMHLGLILGSGVLIYQTSSRMSLLMYLFIFVIMMVLRFKIDFKLKHYYGIISLMLLFLISLFIIQPGFLSKFDQLLLVDIHSPISGDIARINMIRLGLQFLGQSFGLGVGAGNNPVWLEQFSNLPLNHVYNLHNWWLEILTAYGAIVFIAYLLAYILMIYRLFQLRKQSNREEFYTINSLLTFLLIFIAASLTSANNMLIEWHWVFFGMIIAYISVYEDEMMKKEKINYEFGNSNFRNFTIYKK